MEWFIYVMLSAIFLSGVDVLRKRTLKAEHSLELLTTSMIIVVILQLVLIPFTDMSISLFNLALAMLRGIIVAVGILFLTRAMRHMEISSVIPVKNITPIILIFLSVSFLGETVTFLQIIGIFLIVAGSYFLQIHNHYLDFFRHLKEMRNKYFYYAVAGSSLFAISALISKKVVGEVDPVAYMIYSNIFMCIYYVISTFYHYGGWSDIRYAVRRGKYWLPISAVLVILADIFYFRSMAVPGAMIALIIPIRRLSTLFSVIVGGRMFHDHYLFHKIFSTVIILAGTLLVIL